MRSLGPELLAWAGLGLLGLDCCLVSGCWTLSLWGLALSAGLRLSAWRA